MAFPLCYPRGFSLDQGNDGGGARGLLHLIRTAPPFKRIRYKWKDDSARFALTAFAEVRRIPQTYAIRGVREKRAFSEGWTRVPRVLGDSLPAGQALHFLGDGPVG